MSIIKTVLAGIGVASLGYRAYKGAQFLLGSKFLLNNESWNQVSAIALTAKSGPKSEPTVSAPGSAFNDDPISGGSVDVPAM